MRKPLVREYRTRQNYLTRKEVIKALRLSTLTQGAKSLNVTYGVFRRAIKAMRLPGHKAKGAMRVYNLDKEELEKYVRGYSWKELARMFDCTVVTIISVFRRTGVVKRDERSKDRFVPTIKAKP